MKNLPPRHCIALILAGGCSAVLGLLVIVGWHSQSAFLVRIHPSFVPMQYNTALAFLLAGLGMLAASLSRSALARFFGALVFSVGFLTLLEYLLGISLGIDQLFMRDGYSVNVFYPGRMAPNTALNFVLSGLALLLLGKRVKPRWYFVALGYLGLSIAVFGLISIFGYLTGYSGAYTWGGSGIIGMAVHTAFAFAAIGISFALYAWRGSQAEGTSSAAKLIKFNSLETRLIIVLSLLTIFPILSIDWIANSFVFENIRAERIKSVGRVADAKHEQLVMVLTRANDRAKLFLSNIGNQCDVATLNQVCTARLLESYLTAEGAQGATLHRKNGDSLSVGTSVTRNAQDISFQPGQLAKFSGTGSGNNLAYFIVITDSSSGLQLEVSYPSSNLQPIFDTPPELGTSGETFLADGEGYFVTRAKYPSMQGHDIPIHARPMRACLGGADMEVIDLDYRDALIIHGFRLIPEFGSACIMAHMDQAEAFAPLVALKNKLALILMVSLLVILLAAIYIARTIAKPVTQLTQAARAIAGGDYTARVQVEGSDEISELAASFNLMTRQLVAVNAQLEQKIVELRGAEERYRRLFEEATDAIAIADAETGVFLDLNQAFADLVGWKRSELIGKPQKVLHPDADQGEVSDSFERHRSGEAGNVIETQAITRDGKTLEVAIKGTVIELNGRKTVLGTFRDITAQKLAERRLAASYQKLQRLSLYLDKVREDERGRIAREIHDEMGATLTALKMSIHWMTSKLPAELAQLTAEVEHMDKLVADAIHTMRHVVSQLRPTPLHDLGFAVAVKRYVSDFQKHSGIECSLVLPEEDFELNDNQSAAIFRILQECMNNIAKYSQAARVGIYIVKRRGALLLLIRDNGVGFDRSAVREDAFGLLGIRERALMVNGKARISSMPGRGTQVAVRIPLAGR